ncbi:MAG: FAD-binding oxidoreductase [Dehalococcoidia bacterium]
MSTNNINVLLKSASAADTIALRDRLKGEVIVEDSPKFDEARQMRNLLFDRRPAVIARVQDAEDVSESVRYATANGCELSVRSGNHSLAGHGTMDGSLVIDLAGLNSVSIDAKRRIARVGAGANSGQLASAAHAYGLAVSTGDTASVGLGGLITGGGIGWMARKHGLAIDNVLSFEIVTADGEIRRASAKENTDLFWAVRGGGGNFGIVTEFELKLWPDGAVYGGALVLPATKEVLRGYLRFAAAAPDELTTIGTVMHAPPAPFIPGERVGEPVLLIKLVYAGNPKVGERVVAPLRNLATPIADAVSAMPYPVMFNFTNEASRSSFGAIKSSFANELSDESLQHVLESVGATTSPFGMVQVRPLGGAIGRVSTGATAYPHRDKNLLVTVINMWFDGSEDAARHQEWTHATWEGLGTDRSGAFTSFLGDEGRVREAYTNETFAKLALVKAMRDPENVFHFNQNIKPFAEAGEQAA